MTKAIRIHQTGVGERGNEFDPVPVHVPNHIGRRFIRHG